MIASATIPMVQDVLAKLDEARAMTALLQADWRKEHDANRIATASRSVKAWNLRNPDQRKAISARSTARRHGAIVESPGTTAFVLFLHATQHSCPYCLNWLDDTGRSLDHIHPLSKGGKHEPNNLILCCIPCNSRKGASLTWPPAYMFRHATHKSLSCFD